MAASIQASETGLQIVDQARRKKGWTKKAAAWCDAADGLSPSTLDRFWAGKPISQENLVAICAAVGIKDWEAIADFTDLPLSSPKSLPQAGFSAYNPQTFTGRDAETAELTRLLSDDRRMIAIAGMTGIGKTALAERVVANLMGRTEAASLPYYRFSLDDRSLTADFSISGAALLRTLGEEPTLADQQDPANLCAHLLDRLCSQPYRLQIDSLERLLRGNEQEGWSEFCDPLWLNLLEQFLSRSHCPSQLLLTSQDIPADLDAVGSRYPQFWHCQTLQGLNPEEQQDLFLKLGLPQDAESLETLRRIGAFYDGHPLVLQVIADEIRQPPFRGKVDRYWQHYQAEFTPTPSLPHSLTPLTRSRLFRRRVRQRVEQTLQRLPSPPRRMLCASAVFRRPVPIAFWQAMLTDDDPQAAFDTLLDRHLVEYAPDPGDTFLVRQHNLVRSVAYDLLKADIPTWHAAERQAAHLWLADYKPAPDAPNLEAVRGYLEASDHYCEVKDWETAKNILLEPLDSFGKVHILRQLEFWSLYQDGIQICRKNLKKSVPDADAIYLKMLGNYHLWLGSYPKAIDYYEQSLTIAREIGDRQGEGDVLGNMGLVHYRLGHYEWAINYQQQHLTIMQEIGNSTEERLRQRRAKSNALGNLGLAYARLGKYEQAIDHQQQRLTIAREIRDRRSEGNALCGLGLAYYSWGKYGLALDYHQQNLTVARETGDRRGEGHAFVNMGATHLKLGQYPDSLINNQLALEIFQETGDRAGEAEALRNLAELHQALDEVEIAQQYCQQALALATELGIPLASECEALQLKIENEQSKMAGEGENQ